MRVAEDMMRPPENLAPSAVIPTMHPQRCAATFMEYTPPGIGGISLACACEGVATSCRVAPRSPPLQSLQHTSDVSTRHSTVLLQVTICSPSVRTSDRFERSIGPHEVRLGGLTYVSRVTADQVHDKVK
mmetsp:Transcript_18030/g.54314  ORF Transcript_18030/g.54314 Transcript_18030/m.54314 type:complete len:129 (-) Transcript_18030:546-932(-)|eukprot:scaffold204945_cov33-Tisochrysis_lutea.AAC.2